MFAQKTKMEFHLFASVLYARLQQNWRPLAEIRFGLSYSTFPNKWKFEQMEILCFFLQLIREQMEISAVSHQMRLFFAISLQLVREQMEI